MRASAFLVASVLGFGTAGAVVAIAAPAWAACSVSAFDVTTSLVAKGTRSGCTGYVVTFEVRNAKDQAFLPDPIVASKWKDFENGTLSVTGNCNLGNGRYYTWVLQDGSSANESGRRTRC
jgi:hypothetical protein